MQTTVLILALATGVSLAGAVDRGCIEHYSACLQGLQSFGNLQKLDDLCSKAKSVAKCFTDASKACKDGSQETFEDLQALVDEACSPNSTLIKNLNTELECVTTNIQKFRTCSLAKEPPDNMGELCGIFQGYFKCYTEKVKEVCSSAIALERLMKPLTKILTSCSSERGVFFDFCKKQYIKCGLQTLGKGFELKCMDLQELGECMLSVPCSPFGQFTPALGSYVKHVPDYCNSESPFRKNFDKSYQCFLPNFKSVATSCVEALKVEADKMAKSRITDAKEFQMKMLRINQEMISCMLAKAGSPCGKEAEFAVKFLLSPFEDILDQQCLELSQQKCNGALGLMCGSWLLLLSAMFLLIRYFE